jgi:hypothetical protein
VRPRPAKPLKPVGPKNRGTGTRALSPRQENPLTTEQRWSRYLRGPHHESRLQQYRRLYPELQLDDIKGDDLSTLFALAPNPVLSLKYFRAVSASMASGKPRDAIKQVIDLYRRSFLTFRGSGWVTTVAGRLVLEDETTAKEFVRLYWREARKFPSDVRVSALEAVGLTQGDHRQHWLAATRWMRDFQSQHQQPREAGRRFVERAVSTYLECRAVRRHSCLNRLALEAIALVVFEDPAGRVHELKDRALAKLHGISPSMLAHFRADLNSEKKPPGL